MLRAKILVDVYNCLGFRGLGFWGQRLLEKVSVGYLDEHRETANRLGIMALLFRETCYPKPRPRQDLTSISCVLQLMFQSLS